MRSLGTLGGNFSSAYGTNASDDVVGLASDSEAHRRAFLWSDGAMYDLNGIVANLDGWVLDAAYAINEYAVCKDKGHAEHIDQFESFTTTWMARDGSLAKTIDEVLAGTWPESNFGTVARSRLQNFKEHGTCNRCV
jgi:probable HAF family extracellular repeat protein